MTTSDSTTQASAAPAEKHLYLGFFYAALAAALWSLITPASRLLFAMNCPPLETAFWRTCIGGICFAAFAAWRGELKIPLKDAAGLIVYGGVLGLVLFGSFQYSISYSGGATAVVLLYTAPAWVAVLSRIFFSEAISYTKLAAIGIAMGGVVMVSMAGGSMGGDVSVIGIACGLVSGFSYACFFPFTYYYSRRYSPQTIYCYAFLSTTLLFLPFTPDITFDKPALLWGILLAMGFFTSFLAYITLALSLRHISQVQSAVVGNVEPVLGCFWVWLFFQENFSPAGWIGCLFIMLAVFILTLEKKPAPGKRQ